MESRSFSNGRSLDVFRLRDLKNGLYQIHKKNGPAFEGTPKSIFEKAVQLGVNVDDLTYSVNVMKTQHAHYADFDPSGRCIQIIRQQ